MKIDGNSSHWFHGVVTDSEKREHDIDLLNCNGIFFIGIKESNGSYYKDGQHKEGDIIVGNIAVEDVMIMIFFNKKIIILFNDDIFPSNKFSRLIFPKKIII